MNNWIKAGITGLIVGGVAFTIAAIGVASAPLAIAAGVATLVFGVAPIAIGYGKNLYNAHKEKEFAELTAQYEPASAPHSTKSESTQAITTALTSNSPKVTKAASSPKVTQERKVVPVDFQKKVEPSFKDKVFAFFGFGKPSQPAPEPTAENRYRKTA